MRPSDKALVAIFLAWLVIISIGVADLAHGQTFCQTPDHIKEKLANYGEAVVLAGVVTRTGQLMRVYLDPKDGSWTISLQKSATSPECLQMTGDGARIFDWKSPTASH